MILIPEKYAYLFLCSPFVVLYFFILFNNRRHRKDQLIMTLLGAIIGPLSELVYFRDYWFPQSAYYINIGSFPLMLEDVIFGGVAVGIMSVLFDVLFEHDRYEIELPIKNKKKFFSVFGTFIILQILLLLFGVNSIYASAVAMLLGGLVMLYYRRDLYLNSIVSALGFMFVLFMSYSFVFLLASNTELLMRDIWYIYGTSLDVRFLRIPLTEIIWSFCAGFFIGPLYKFVYDLGYYFDNAQI